MAGGPQKSMVFFLFWVSMFDFLGVVGGWIEPPIGKIWKASPILIIVPKKDGGKNKWETSFKATTYTPILAWTTFKISKTRHNFRGWTPEFFG